MATELRAFSSAPTDLAPGQRLASGLAAAGRRLLQWDARYRQRRRLAELPDAALDDMGISRRAAASEAGKAFWQD
jgi:uncharacterized protein YjiS (DUF1127 family)